MLSRVVLSGWRGQQDAESPGQMPGGEIILREAEHVFPTRTGSAAVPAGRDFLKMRDTRRDVGKTHRSFSAFSHSCSLYERAFGSTPSGISRSKILFNSGNFHDGLLFSDIRLTSFFIQRPMGEGNVGFSGISNIRIPEVWSSSHQFPEKCGEPDRCVREVLL